MELILKVLTVVFTLVIAFLTAKYDSHTEQPKRLASRLTRAGTWVIILSLFAAALQALDPVFAAFKQQQQESLANASEEQIKNEILQVRVALQAAEKRLEKVQTGLERAKTQ
jgi:hypothetical protein